MALNFKISTAARTAACDAIVDLIDAGAGAGTLKVFIGAPPANVADADPGGANLLATLTFSDPAFGAAATGVATASAITSDTTADNSGDAGCFRVKDSNALTIMQGTAGVAGDTPDMTFTPTKAIVAGGTVACTSFTVTVPIGP